MNEASNKQKLQIVEKIKSSTNILVTVSKNPSVDELSAALGLTLLLNKAGKHTTAVFSGTIPPAIVFLDPDKIFESTIDSLRDFIIALDKEKADHLRYKLEGDLVKIYITPYRATISKDDLKFDMGDFNVELVLALGVDSQEHLDTALASQSKVVHDVTIATLSVPGIKSTLGSLDWQEPNASSLCEMVTILAASLPADGKTLLDQQISTALLTGIVAATERFSNSLTTSAVMTAAADLMAAGADQQLIAAKLQESHTISALPTAASEPTPQPIAETPVEEVPVDDDKKDETPSSSDSFGGGLSIDHSEPASSTLPPEEPTEPEKPEESTTPELTSTLPEPETISSNDEVIGHAVSSAPATAEPSLGGTLSATAEQAAEDAKRELEDDKNKKILKHAYLGGPSTADSSISMVSGSDDDDADKPVDIFADTPLASSGSTVSTLEPTHEAVIEPPTLPMPPSLPDFSTLPPPVVEPASFNDSGNLAPNPFSTLPPDNNDPSQFRIPTPN